MSDSGYDKIQPGALAVYIPSYKHDVISRNEFEIYLAFGLPEHAVKPYSSQTIKFTDTNIANVLSSIHDGVPDIQLLFHPSIGAYIDIV